MTTVFHTLKYIHMLMAQEGATYGQEVLLAAGLNDWPLCLGDPFPDSLPHVRTLQGRDIIGLE